MLYKHQKEIVEFVNSRSHSMVISPMGSGKTRAILTAIEGNTLIIAPLRVAKYVWQEEAENVGKDCVFIKGKSQYRKSKDNIYCTNFENKHIELPENVDTLIIDESSKLKGFQFRQGTIRAKKLFTLSHKCKKVVLLTGTPCSESLGDLYSQISFLDAGKTFGKSKFQFMWKYHFDISHSNKFHIWKPKPDAYNDVINKASDYVRYFEPDIQVHGSISTNLKFDTTNEQLKVLKQLEKTSVYKDKDNTVYAVNRAVLASKLLHICSGFSYTEQKNICKYDCKRLDTLKEILEDNSGERFVIVAYWKASMSNILENIEDITTNIEDFKSNNVKHLLINPASAAHGLSLQNQSRSMVLYEPFFSCEQYEQVLERIGERRQAQSGLNRTVYYYYLYCSQFDKSAWEALKTKADVEQTIIDLIRG